MIVRRRCKHFPNRHITKIWSIHYWLGGSRKLRTLWLLPLSKSWDSPSNCWTNFWRAERNRHWGRHLSWEGNTCPMRTAPNLLSSRSRYLGNWKESWAFKMIVYSHQCCWSISFIKKYIGTYQICLHFTLYYLFTNWLLQLAYIFRNVQSHFMNKKRQWICLK